MTDPARDEFFIAYHPTPQRLRSFLLLVAMALLIAFPAIAALLASFQGGAGTGTWNTAEVSTIEGRFISRPYPMIKPLDGSMPVLLVEQGKFGAQQRTGSQQDSLVQARGALIQRDDMRMLELLPADDSFTQSGAIVDPADSSSISEDPEPIEVELVGEVMDAKCYLGVMKPGQGKPHRACAALCIAGGIPALFAVADGDSPVEVALLASTNGGRVPDALLRHVGEPIRISGELRMMADMPVIQVRQWEPLSR